MYLTALKEHDLYNLTAGGGGVNVEHVIYLINRNMALHLRYEHNYTLRAIAARLGVKMKDVKKWINEFEAA